MKRFQTFLTEATDLPEEAKEVIYDMVAHSLEWHQENIEYILNDIDEAWSKDAEKVMQKAYSKADNKDDYEDAEQWGYDIENVETFCEQQPDVAKYAKKITKTPLIKYFLPHPGKSSLGPLSVRDADFGNKDYVLGMQETYVDHKGKMPVELYWQVVVEGGMASPEGNVGLSGEDMAIAVAEILDPKTRGVSDKRALKTIENALSVDGGLDDKTTKAVLDNPMKMAKDVFVKLKNDL